jgi:hypothetical protein
MGSNIKTFEEWNPFKKGKGKENLSKILNLFNLTFKDWKEFLNMFDRAEAGSRFGDLVINKYGIKEKNKELYNDEGAPEFNPNSPYYWCYPDPELSTCMIYFIVDKNFTTMTVTGRAATGSGLLKNKNLKKKIFPYVNGKPDLQGMANYHNELKKEYYKGFQDKRNEWSRKHLDFISDNEPFDDYHSMDTSTFDSYKYKRKRK